MAVTIASLLADFSPSSKGENMGINILRPVKPVAEAAPVQAPPPVDRQAELIRSVEAKARAEEREAAGKRLDEALAAERARFEQELNSEREVWVEQQALQLSGQIQSTLARIEADLSDRVGRILRPFVAQAYHDQALAEFKETLATVLAGAEGKHMRITGPKDILMAIKASLGAHETAIDFLPNEHVEVTLITQDTIVHTQFNSWLSGLEQALKAE
jgi:hypothetical protein